MSIDMSQFFQVFFEESAEHLAEMERLLLEMDVENPDIEEMNAIFRAAHSIKGGSGTFGFTDMTEVTHVLENLLDRLRKGEMAPRAEMIDVFLEAADVLKEQLASHINGTDSDVTQAKSVCDKLQALTQDHHEESAPAEPEEPPGESGAPPEAERAEIVSDIAPETDAPATSTRIFDITFRPDSAFLKNTDGILELTSELSRLGQLEVLSEPEQASDKAASKKKASKDKKQKKEKKSGKKGDAELREWHFRLTTEKEIEAIRDIFDFIAKSEDISIHLASEQPAAENGSQADAGYGFFDAVDKPDSSEDSGYGFFTDIPFPTASAGVLEDGDGYGFFTPDAASEGGEDPGYGFFTDLPAPAAGAAPTADDGDGYGFFAPLESRPAEPAPPKAEAVAPKPAPAAAAKPKDKPAAAVSTGETSIRVGVERVDQLINLVGELVITQAMLAQTASDIDPVIHQALHNGLAQLQRNTRDLQESVMSIRMMPISFVFSRFPRVVRDLAAKLNKQVELVTVGETTELDKGLIEKIADPLTHLVRNSLDHGIESPEKRVAAGKPAKGTITLSASHQGGNIIIQVADDGGGLNRDKILSKAMERGLNASETMPDNEVWMLIFEPGFSTADVVTDVSGRGVGMDVVKRNITEMGGSVQIGSAPGIGTTMTISLPLTLAILDGMSVALGGSIYVIPLNLIVETMQPRPEDLRSVAGQGHMVHVRGEYLPIISLSKVFNMPTEISDPCSGVLVLIEAEDKKAALFVDALVGQQQVVIKSLETNFRKIVGVSGATIMGDGRVALILDVPTLIKMGQ